MDSVIYTRIRELCEERGITVTKLESLMGMSQSSIGRWRSTASPSAENLAKVARFFGVSLDYLIGDSNIQSRDATAQAICQYTKLSEKAVEQLLNLQRKESLLETEHTVSIAELISMFIADPLFGIMIETLQSCLDSTYRFYQKGQKISNLERELARGKISDLVNQTGVDFVILPDFDIPDYYHSQTNDYCLKIITSIVNNYELPLYNAEGGDDCGKLQDND